MNNFLKNRFPVRHHEKKLRIIFLQGPVGPFFSRLCTFLEGHNYDVLRVCFHPGDRFFAKKGKRFDFKGGKDLWADWFRDFIERTKPDALIYFGSARKIHSTARILAEKAGIPILSLEEGYLRSGYITVELGANNAQSLLAGLLPPESFIPEAESITPERDFMGFQSMCLFASQYYIIRTLFSNSKEKEVFHRHFQPTFEIFAWARNVYQRYSYASLDRITITKLLADYDKCYFIVPLQVSSDSQLAKNALGWSNHRLIVESLNSFARYAPETHRILFKIHPLERGHSNDRRLIQETAKRLKIENRVDVIQMGSPSLLTAHSAGMITINSTTGFLALTHGVPLLVIGAALYANSGLATCAHGAPDFDSFWTSNFVAEQYVRERYLAWIKAHCLKPGDFYAREGMKHACAGILQALKTLKEQK